LKAEFAENTKPAGIPLCFLCLFVAKKVREIRAISGYFCAFESLWPILSFARYSSTPKVKKCKKMVQKVYILVHFCSKHVHFCKKNAKKRKKTLIFTLIFEPKTNKSYKITLFTTANHPIFQNFPQKPLFSPYFPTFFICLILSGTHCAV